MRAAVAHGDGNIVKALGGTGGDRPLHAMVDPIENIDPKIPTIAMNGDKDRVVPAFLSENYVAAAKKVGATSSFVMIPGGNHSPSSTPTIPNS